ncbi:hypothetical protein MD588_25535 [Photobacterium sp. SDRW27]|uniref:hypothetical protein n=1 Tax=Photobacterium obscurum TaxID=2829490 RepID=UPI0022440895|nr:hypothetical protein [Photobacterium obscurum]MCW8332156.1 hypothetical protein [Photobacterium obscurum]
MGTFTDRPFIEFSDQTVKYRRNLLIFSCALFILIYNHVGIESGKSINFLGIPLSGLSINDVKLYLSLAVGYQLFHFLWRCWDEWWAWRLKLSGENLGLDGPVSGNTYVKAISDVCAFTHFMPDVTIEQRIASVMTNRAKFLKDEVDRYGLTDDVVSAHVESLEKVVNVDSGFARDIERIQRFEKHVRGYSIQQQLRFHALEIGVPVLLSIFSLCAYLGSIN